MTDLDIREMLMAKISRFGDRRRLQNSLAKEIGITDSMLSMVLHAKRKPTPPILKFLGVERVVTVSYRMKKANRSDSHNDCQRGDIQEGRS